MLVDTGADVSILKVGKILLQNSVDNSKIIDIKGVTEGLTKSLGIINTEIWVKNNQTIGHNFHVVSDDFPIPGDGILGRDFLIKYSANLDYGRWTLNLRYFNKNFVIPILSGVEENQIHIPPRCEVIRQIPSLKNISESVLVLNKEPLPGVFIARTVVSPGEGLVKIMNTTFESVILKNIQLEVISLDKFNIYNINADHNDRHEKLMNQLNKEMPDFIQSEVISLCKDYSDIFALKDDILTVNNFYKQKLKLSDPKPVYTKNYRLPMAQKGDITNHVQNLLKHKIIEPSVSEYNNPILLVPKKGPNGQKSSRLVLDFRNVNKKLIADKFPLPRIDDILDQLGRAKWFSVIDLYSGFHQIELDVDSRDITSFSTESGSYRFTRLPFGLSVSPNSFQRMMTIAFAGLTPEKAFLYMDDLIVIGCSENHHLKNLKEVFETCRKFNLKLNPEKCNFFRNEVTFLGHKITDKGILPDDSKFEVINKYPTPTNADEVKRFVAFCNYYRRFIPRFAEITQPLNQLTRKGSKFIWSKSCQDSFVELKKALINPQILKYPDFSKQFILTTDSSDLACGAVLSQMIGGQEFPISYGSKAFTKGESHKPTILKELTAIHWAVKHFRCYLYGQKFLIKTDHKPLVYLFSMKDPSSKLTRMRLDLEEFNFEIEYIKGRQNVCADALSRINIDNLKEINHNTSQILAVTRSMSKSSNNTPSERNAEAAQITNQVKVYNSINNYDSLNLPYLRFKVKNIGKSTLENYEIDMLIYDKRKVSTHVKISITNGDILALEQILSKLDQLAGERDYKTLRMKMNDPIFTRFSINEFKRVGQNILRNICIVLLEPRMVIVDKDERLKLVEKYHNDPMYGGHCGQKRLLKKLKSFYYWKGMSRDVAQYTRQCHNCQINKINRRHNQPFVITPTPQNAFDIVCIDTVGPFPKTSLGNRYAVTIQCELSKYVVISPIPNKEAPTVARAILEDFILIYGPMKEIRTDMGTEYKNEVFSNLAELLKIQHKISTAYHSQTIGGCERNHRVLNDFIKMYINESQSDWDTWTKYFTFCYNTTPMTYHNYTPYELVFARRANLSSDIFCDNRVDPLYSIEAYDQEIRFRLQFAQNRARNYLESAKIKRKELHDKDASQLHIEEGDLILITNEARQKFDPWWKGPYTVVSASGPNCIIVDKNGRRSTVHKNRIKKYMR